MIDLPESLAPEIGRSGETRGHRCKVCGRSFSSGKALGGHVSSAHIQAANKEYPHLKLKSEIKDSGRRSGLYTCGVCAKLFQSRKSLYGHMRCHPDRSWRGVEPPTDPDSDSYSGPEQDDEESCHNDIPWLVKGRRGRPGNVLHVPVRSLGSEETKKPVVAREGPEWVESLSIENEVNSKKRKGRKSESESEDYLFQAAVSVLANGRRRMSSSYLKNQEKLSPAKREGSGHSYKLICGSCNKSFLQSLHVCVVCEKSFSSGQALGGHMKCHNNNKKKNSTIGYSSSKGGEGKEM